MTNYFGTLPSEILSLLLLDNFSSIDLISILPDLNNIKPFSLLLISRRFLLSLYRRDISSFRPLPNDFTYETYMKIFDKKTYVEAHGAKSYDLTEEAMKINYLADQGYNVLLYTILNDIADIRDRLLYCNNTMMRVIKNKHFQMTEEILTIQDHILTIDPNLRRSAIYYNNNALSFAAAAGRSDLMDMLMTRGADVYCLALAQSAIEGHIEIVSKMMDKLNRHHTDDREMSKCHYEQAIRYASNKGHIAIVKLLTDSGFINYNGMMHWATAYNYIEVVKIMLDKGANNLTHCLEVARKYNHTQIIELLEKCLSVGMKKYLIN